jgi:hypothetical protein
MGIDVTWGRGQNQLLLSRYLIEEEVKLERGGKIGLNQSLICIHPSHRLSPQYNVNLPLFNPVFLFLVQQPPLGQGFLIYEVSRSHTMRHHIR